MPDPAAHASATSTTIVESVDESVFVVSCVLDVHTHEAVLLHNAIVYAAFPAVKLISIVAYPVGVMAAAVPVQVYVPKALNTQAYATVPVIIPKPPITFPPSHVVRMPIAIGFIPIDLVVVTPGVKRSSAQ